MSESGRERAWKNQNKKLFIAMAGEKSNPLNMISFVSFPTSLPAINFSGNAMASSSCRPIVAFATVTATVEAHSSWIEQPRPSYLNSSCSLLYGILSIPVGASNQEIKAAYRRLAKVCHPDMAAIDQKKLIHTTYFTFSDPNKRANYDQNLFWQQRSRDQP
ncbi:Chaperone protein dnaJ 11, chloroplastic [Glycine soja]